MERPCGEARVHRSLRNARLSCRLRLPRETTKTPRSAIEQLLLAEALTRSLFDITIPVPHEDPLFMEVMGLQPGIFAPSGPQTSSGLIPPSVPLTVLIPSMDLTFIKDLVAAYLGSMAIAQ